MYLQGPDIAACCVSELILESAIKFLKWIIQSIHIDFMNINSFDFNLLRVFNALMQERVTSQKVVVAHW